MTALPRFRRFAARALPMILVIVPAEARIGRLIEDPVVVQLHAPRARTLAGEGITLDLTVRVRAKLEMESANPRSFAASSARRWQRLNVSA